MFGDYPIGRKRHEQFCQELAQGRTPAEAWRAAGFVAFPSSDRLRNIMATPLIRARVDFLRQPAN